MNGPRDYVTSLVEDSLGIAKGSLADDKGELLPNEFVEKIAGILKTGEAPNTVDAATPYLEKELLGLLPRIRDHAMKEDGFFARKARWPNASPFAVCLTHDVDNITRPFSHVWKIRKRFGTFDLVRAAFGASLYDNTMLIASAEEGRGFRSSFYFMSSEYPLERVRHVSDLIRNDGWDIGLHGDFGTHDSSEKMDEAIEKFTAGMGFRPMGLREHYLRFDFAKSWTIMEAAGFDYDSTVGNTDKLGFRVGMATPFHPPGDDWSPLNLLELPLTLMDTTLWGYLKRTEEEGMTDSLAMMQGVEEVEGLFTLLWHQESVRMNGGRIYWKLIDAVKKKGCFVGSGAEVAKWWRARSVPLVKKGNLITLGGRPPDGLVLQVETDGGRTPHVTSGSVEKTGAQRYAVVVGGPEFTMEVS